MRFAPNPILAGALILGTGCAHTQKTEPSDLERLQQQAGSLRKRVQVLEQRMARMEHPTGTQGAPGAHGNLPVVRLAPPPAARARPPVAEPAAPTRASARDFSLQVPNSAPQFETAASLDSISAAHPVSEPAAPTPAPAVRRHTPATVPAAAPPTPARSTGDAKAVRSFKLVGSRLVELTKANAPKRPDRPATKTRKGKAIVAQYKEAMAVYREDRYAEAEAMFAQFAKTYPKHDYADNALYWRGEAAYDQGHYADALASFTAVVERYGGGNKAPDALLKIGLCYARLSDPANARDVLTQLTAAYPNTRAADLARQKIAEL